MMMVKDGKEVSLAVDETSLNRSPHAKLTCVACHTGFDADNIPHKDPITPVNCTTCHSDAGRKHAFHPEMIRATGTNGKPATSCKSCHGTHDIVSPKVPGSKFHSSNLTNSCGLCHSTVSRTYFHSAHAAAAAEGVKGAPSCLTCHRNDITRVRPGRDLAQLKIAQEKMCLSCHLDDPDVRARTAPTAGFIAAYEKSVHGAALLQANAKAANCVDCHGSHEVAKGTEPSAKINKKNTPETCGTCHADVAREFTESAHSIAVSKGNRDAPVCTDCHGEHNILSHLDPRSPVAPLNVSGKVCSPCHSSLALSEKYGLDSDRFKTFSDSYHGLASRAGSLEVANCASCHGVHNIKSSSDPTSMIHKDNLAKTCGSCHPGANERFGIGSVHVNVRSKEEDPLLYWIATAYLIMIVSIIGGMAAHNIADFIRKSRRKLLIRRGIVHEAHMGHHLYVRMTLSERIQHGTLAASFILLVITGFMLRYPEAWWVVSLRNLSDSVFDLRGLVHRIAAVIIVGASLYHIYYIRFTERGRELIRDLLPRWQDVRDTVAVVRYNFGFSKEKPRLGRFSYIEKSEYWALVWGTVVMGATGVIMWFDNTFIGILTKLGYDVARVIHFYEAWLATLAILVWHFYYVMFNPDTYPINFAFWTGTITEHEMAEEHPLELEEVKKKQKEQGMIAVTPSEAGKTRKPRK
ncbi:MAG: cytochrome b/b6 domain-containing protein [Ignavibacteriales bacterium]|nr:cytochrome b/b6 domain-containing protein [Ignavibacteriales bacterium]